MKWISVKDRLPTDDSEVLLCLSGYLIDSLIVGRWSLVGHCWVRGLFGNYVEGDVTHWLPIPERPE